LIALLVGVALVLVTACGSDDGGDDESFDRPDDATTDAADTSDEPADDLAGACELLSTDDVEALLEQGVGDGEQEDVDDATTQCTWSTDEPSLAVGDPITLQVELGALTDEVSAQIDEALADDANQPLVLGDRSVLVCGLGADGSDCDSYDTVAVAVGQSYLEVDLGNWGYPDDFTEEQGVQITVDAAEQAVDGLG
jgi:hypothetical protein